MRTEMEFHIHTHAEQLMREGMPAEEAVRRARVEFGSVESHKEECRASMGVRAWDELGANVRYTLRMLRKSPGVTVIAIVTLALGIGASTAIFSVVDAAVLRPLPYREPDRLVTLTRKYTHDFSYNVSVPNFIDWRREGSELFENASAFDPLPTGLNLLTSGTPQRLSALHVGANFFQTLGIQPVLGRPFVQGEDKEGQDGVIVISHRLWREQFGADGSAVGRTLVLSGRPYTVVGVAPPGFRFLHEADAWVPLVLETTSQDRKANVIESVARLRPGVSLASAQAAMKVVGERLAQAYPDSDKDFEVGVIPFVRRTTGDIRTPVLVLLGAVMLVLLVACANVANLLLAQSTGRQREIALRAAIGATRGRIVRQLLTESVLLSLCGMAAGLLFARWATSALVRYSPTDLALINDVQLDSRVLAFSVLLALVTGIAFGTAPALQAAKLDLNDVLKKGGRTGSASPRRRLRSSLVVSEVAIALVLSVGAGLLIDSFVRLLQVDPGFNPKQVLNLRLSLPGERFKTATDMAAYSRKFLPKISGLPGVESAAVSTSIPLDLCPDFPVTLVGRDLNEHETPELIYIAVSPDYFHTLQIPVLQGRGFSESDNENSAAVAVVSEEFAKQWWPQGNAVGQHIWIAKTMGPQFADDTPREIIGVVRDVRNDALREHPRPTSYIPLSQVHAGLVPLLTRLLPLNVVVRTAGEPLAMSTPVQQQIWSVDAQQAVAGVRSLDSIAQQSVAMERFVAWLLGIFGTLVVLLAAVGIYGVISYSVTQRSNEIGIRMALGASRGRVLRMIVEDGLRLTGGGIAMGLLLALLATRILQSLLFNVRPWEPAIYGAIVGLLLVIALAASLVPARRAMGVDPMVALRYE
jgi:putative ABC transport system permease protein